MIVAIGLVLLLCAVGCLFDPFIGMLALMGINMIQPGELYPIFNSLHVERTMALLTIAVVLVRGTRLNFPPTVRWCLFFYAAVVASVPLSFWVTNALVNALDFGKTILLAVLVAVLATTRERLRAVLLLFSGLVAYLAASSLVEYFQGNFQFRMNVDRAVGLTSISNNPDTLGLTIATAIPLMFLFTLRSNPGWLRWTMRALIAVSMWALLLTGSRGTVLTMALLLGTAALVHRRRALLVPAALCAGLLVWAVLPAQYQARYSTVNHLQNDESYQNRKISWEGGWRMFLSNPLTGVGVGDYTDANGAKFWPAPGRKIYLNAHSLYFQILGELGLVGIVGFVGFLWMLFGANRRLARVLRTDPTAPAWLRYYPLACGLALVGLLYSGYAYHDLYRNTWYFLAGTTGALQLIRERETVSAPLPSPAVAPELSAATQRPPANIFTPPPLAPAWADWSRLP